jgi:hypothetical protein
MPIHDWTRVDAGLFHAFHQHWIISLCDALNAGGLPGGYFALPEQSVRGPIPDVLALHLPAEGAEPASNSPGVAVSERAPRTQFVSRSEASTYARRADRVTVRHRHGDVVSVVEIVSPGNKGSNSELNAFVAKTVELIHKGVHALIIDLFPPTKRDPFGIHKAVWDEFVDEDFVPLADKPLTVAAYDAGPPQVAYVESVGVGDRLPDAPLFLKPEFYVPAPLEASYGAAWDAFPRALKRLLDGPGDPPASDR